MDKVTARQTIKQCFQEATYEQVQQYHLTHDCFTGKPLTKRQLQRLPKPNVNPTVDKKQRNLSSLNEVLYPAPTLGTVMQDSLAALKMRFDKPDTKEATLDKPSDDLLNRVIDWYEQYKQDGLATLLPKQSGQLTEANVEIVKQAFSHNTILIQNVCMLSAFWIRSPLDWDTKGEADLLEHLYMQYEAPAFLRACWSNGADEESVQWLLAYVLYAQGGSLKALAKHWDWKVASHKLWHGLFACPSDMTPLEAVLHAEFKRLGGWDEDFHSLMGNKAYVIDLLQPNSVETWDFWYDTCRWLISKQYDLAAEDMRDILTWARHQFTEFARRGEAYRLQGRSLAKVLESIAVEKQEQLRIERERARLAERARQVSMARAEERERLREQEEARQQLQYSYEDINVSWSGQGWSWMEIIEGHIWCFTELTTSQMLNEEGDAMNHCVGGYSMDCLDGISAIFSLSCDDERAATIEVQPSTKELVQVQGEFNAEVPKLVNKVIKKWLTRVVKPARRN